MNRPVFPVILSGGAGRRLWPLSREHHPKQFIALEDEHTLLQATARRLDLLEAVRAPIVVCNEEHRFMAAEQLRVIGVVPEVIGLEPVGRNTAPAIAVAALEARARCGEGEEPILLVLPSDHVIRRGESFARAVRAAVEEAAAGRLVTFGVAPDRAETGYGYIRAGAPTGVSGAALAVERFVEKPDAARAAAWVEADGWYWNSGMFVFEAARYLRELGVHAAPVRDAVEEAHEKAVRTRDFLELDPEAFARSPAISVDRAVMEHTADAVVAPLEAGWSDVGSWAVLADLAGRDEAGNAVRGDVVLERTRDTWVWGEDRLVAVAGAEDLVVVDTADAVLVARRNALQEVAAVVERLERSGRDELKHHRKVHRPWGSYDSVHVGGGFKIKHITVAPGQRLSLQMHHRRAEHWIVVRGAARVTRGDDVFVISENQSTHIPRGVRHRLENPGAEPLELVEVQVGDYLGEDDIVRFEDVYGRAGPDAPSACGREGSTDGEPAAEFASGRLAADMGTGFVENDGGGVPAVRPDPPAGYLRPGGAGPKRTP